MTTRGTGNYIKVLIALLLGPTQGFVLAPREPLNNLGPLFPEDLFSQGGPTTKRDEVKGTTRIPGVLAVGKGV